MVSSPQCVTLFMQSWFYIDGMLNVVVTVVNIVSINNYGKTKGDVTRNDF